MTTPKRAGFRPIVVAGRRFVWRFRGRVVVVDEGAPRGQVLEIDVGWYDAWLFARDPQDAPPPPAMAAITPRFVASAIAFALERGWNRDVRGGRWVVECARDGGLRVRAAGDASA